MTDDIRCSRCETDLPAEAFAPSQRKPGAWCRSCRRDYSAGYWLRPEVHDRQAARLAAEKSARQQKRAERRATPRPCRGCTAEFVPWSPADHPGQADSFCRTCYNELARARYLQRQGSIQRRTPRDNYDPTTGSRPQGKRWQTLRAGVISEESDCGICGITVDKTLPSTHKMSATIDHIVSLAVGGDYWDRSNLRLAHRSCNAKEGNRLRQRVAEQRIEQLEARVLELEALLGLPPRLYLVS